MDAAPLRLKRHLWVHKMLLKMWGVRNHSRPSLVSKKINLLLFFSALNNQLTQHLFLYILIRVSQFFVLSWCRLQKMSKSEMSMLFWCLLVYYIMPCLDLWHILVMFTSQRSQNWSPIEELRLGSCHARAPDTELWILRCREVNTIRRKVRLNCGITVFVNHY